MEADDDHATKCWLISEMLIARAQSVYAPDKVVSIDEEKSAARGGRLQFRQYIPGNATSMA